MAQWLSYPNSVDQGQPFNMRILEDCAFFTPRLEAQTKGQEECLPPFLSLHPLKEQAWQMLVEAPSPRVTLE